MKSFASISAENDCTNMYQSQSHSVDPLKKTVAMSLKIIVYLYGVLVLYLLCICFCKFFEFLEIIGHFWNF